MLAKKVVGVAVFWSSFFMCRAGRARHVTSFSLLFLILFLPFHFLLLPCSYADYADGSPEFLPKSP